MLRISCNLKPVHFFTNKKVISIVASMVKYDNDLDCSLRYEPIKSKFIKILKTHHFRLAYEDD